MNLRLLKVIQGKGIMLSKHRHLDIIGYTDYDFMSSKVDRKSTLGYHTFVGGIW